MKNNPTTFMGRPIQIIEPGWWELVHACCEVRTVITSDTAVNDGKVLVFKYCKEHNQVYMESPDDLRRTRQ